MSTKKKTKQSRFKIRYLLIAIVLVCAGIFTYYLMSLRAVGIGDNKVQFVISQEESYDDVLQNLEEENLIRSSSAAKIYARFSSSSDYYAGVYNLNDGMSTQEILEYISKLENAGNNQISVTIPEGKWAKEIAELVAENNTEISSEDLLEAWNDISYIKTLAKDYEFLDVDVLNNSDYNVKLEGYLFPDTYYFAADADVDTITRTFLDRFSIVYEKYKDDIEESGYTLQEILSLASVVQFESATKEDMEKISGVFHNRLDEDMKLQSSVTVCYALYDDFEDPTDCEVNYDIDSPYNTYKHDGIPIGPILNPGEDAIYATLHPADHEYLYFLADINGDGTVYYSKTLDEHEEKMKELNLVLE